MDRKILILPYMFWCILFINRVLTDCLTVFSRLKISLHRISGIWIVSRIADIYWKLVWCRAGPTHLENYRETKFIQPDQPVLCWSRGVVHVVVIYESETYDWTGIIFYWQWVRKAAAALLNRRLSHLSYKDQGAALWQVKLSHRSFHDFKNKITSLLSLV